MAIASMCIVRRPGDWPTQRLGECRCREGTRNRGFAAPGCNVGLTAPGCRWSAGSVQHRGLVMASQTPGAQFHRCRSRIPGGIGPEMRSQAPLGCHEKQHARQATLPWRRFVSLPTCSIRLFRPSRLLDTSWVRDGGVRGVSYLTCSIAGPGPLTRSSVCARHPPLRPCGLGKDLPRSHTLRVAMWNGNLLDARHLFNKKRGTSDAGCQMWSIARCDLLN